MPRQFNNELKTRILARLREGTSVEQLAREYEPSSATIHKWRREAQQASLETGSVSLEEHRRVLQRNAELEETVAILERATAFFESVKRTQSILVIMQKMRTIHADDDSAGVRPMQKLRLQQDIYIGLRRTHRLMRQASLHCYVQCKYVVTTQSERRIATPNRVQRRQFHRTSVTCMGWPISSLKPISYFETVASATLMTCLALYQTLCYWGN